MPILTGFPCVGDDSSPASNLLCSWWGADSPETGIARGIDYQRSTLPWLDMQAPGGARGQQHGHRCASGRHADHGRRGRRWADPRSVRRGSARLGGKRRRNPAAHIQRRGAYAAQCHGRTDGESSGVADLALEAGSIKAEWLRGPGLPGGSRLLARRSAVQAQPTHRRTGRAHAAGERLSGHGGPGDRGSPSSWDRSSSASLGLMAQATVSGTLNGSCLPSPTSGKRSICCFWLAEAQTTQGHGARPRSD